MDESETATLQPEMEPRLQIVYILTNPSMPGLVKIGRTTNLEARIASLSSSTSVPEAFEVAYAAYVEDASFVERAMHAAFSLHRMPGREFFRLPVANAIAALSLAEVEQVEINEETADGEQIIEEIRDRGRKPNPKIIDFLTVFRTEHGRPPSGSEIKSYFPGIPTSTAYDYAKRA